MKLQDTVVSEINQSLKEKEWTISFIGGSWLCFNVCRLSFRKVRHRVLEMDGCGGCTKMQLMPLISAIGNAKGPFYVQQYHNTNNKSPKLDDIIHCDGKNSSPTFVTTQNVSRQFQMPRGRQNWPDCKLLHWGTRVRDLDPGKTGSLRKFTVIQLDRFRTFVNTPKIPEPELLWSIHSQLTFRSGSFLSPLFWQNTKKNNLRKKVFSCCGSQFKGIPSIMSRKLQQ